MKQPDACIVRITDAEGNTLGTGFLVSADGRIATCAHVMEGIEPHVAFPSGEPRPAQAVATDPAHDVVILKLEVGLPPDAEPARLGHSAEGYYSSFRSRGYRPLGEMQGIPAEGRVLHAVSECRGMQYLPLILKSQDIRKGMSGAPVYIPDLDLVVGMITGYWDALAAETGYADRDTVLATPSEAIAALDSDFQLFESPSALSPWHRLCISPVSVFERVYLSRFAGRQWLIDEIDNFLQTKDRGYFVLEASAGLGKTTLLAYLVQKRGYIHHFVELAPGLEGVAQGLGNLAAQLVRNWKLPADLIEELHSDIRFRPDLLPSLLTEAARKRDETHPGEKIVIVVDALDEAGVPSGQNVMGLPRVLPGGVYFLVSQRPTPVVLHVEGPRPVFYLQAESEDNRDDMRAYLETATTWPGVARRLAESGSEAEEFVNTLLEKCRGVWIYLHYIVEEIERGERAPLSVDALPNDLWQYYAQTWQRWRESDGRREAGWNTDVLPLLSTLAAAREGLPFQQLCTFAGVAAKPARERQLRDAWSSFLAEDEGAEDRCYRLYHTSLRQFLHGEADLARLTTAERSLVEEMADATRQAHARIADRYLGAWGGLQAGLPGLGDSEKRDLDGGYGLRHMATHLAEAGRIVDLDHLLQIETAEGKNAWYEAHVCAQNTLGYLTSIEQAWHAAEQADSIAAESARPSPYLGAELRCALYSTSIHSLSGNIPPILLAALVEHRLWTPAQAVAYARQVPGHMPRAQALVELVPYLAEVQKKQALRDALSAARAIEEEDERAKALFGVAACLDEPLKAQVFQEVLQAAGAIQDAGVQAQALVALGPHLCDAPKMQTYLQALTMARKIPDRSARVETLGNLAPRLPAPLRDLTLHEALAGALEAEDGGARTNMLVQLAPHLTEELVPKALAAVWEIENGKERTRALSELAPYLSGSLLDGALEIIRQIDDEQTRTHLLVCLVPHLPKPLRQEVLREIRPGVKRLAEEDRIEALALLIPHLPERSLLLRAAAAVYESPPGLPVGAWRTSLQHFVAGVFWQVLVALFCFQLGVRSEGARERLAFELARRACYQESLAVAITVWWPTLLKGGESWAEVVTGLALHCALVQEEDSAVRDWMGSPLRAERLAAWVTHLPPPMLRTVLAVVEQLPAWKSAQEFSLHSIKYPRRLWDQPDRDDYAAILVGLAHCLPMEEQEAVLQEAFAVATAIQDGQDRTEVIARLVPWLGGLGYAREALAVVGSRGNWIWGRESRVQALVELAPHLQEPALQAEALAITEHLQDRTSRREVLAALIPHLSADLLLTQATEAVFKEDWGRKGRMVTRVCMALARHLPVKLVWVGAQAVLGITTTTPTRQEVVNLAVRMAVVGRYKEALVVAAVVEGDNRARAIIGMASHLSELQAQEVLALAKEMEFGVGRAEALWGMAPYLSQSQRSEALQEALTTVQTLEAEAWSDNRRSWTSPDVKAELTAKRRNWCNQIRIRLLSALAPCLSEPSKTEAMKEAWAAAQTVENMGDRAKALADLSRTLAELGYFHDALAAVQEIQDTDQQSGAWVGLAVHLAQSGHPREAMATAQVMPPEWKQAELLASEVPHLPRQELEKALREILATSVPTWKRARPGAWVELIPHLPEPERQALLTQALVEAQAIQDIGDRVRVLTRLAPHLPEPECGRILRQALAAAQTIQNGVDRATVLTGLLPSLSEPEHEEAVQQALAAVQATQNGEHKIGWLIKLIRQLRNLASPGELLSLKQAIPGLDPLSAKLADWISPLAELDPWAALATARTIGQERRRIEVLLELASELNRLGRSREALAALHMMGGDRQGAEVFAELASELASFPRDVLYPLWREALPFLADGTRRELLADLRALVPVIIALGGADAVLETWRAVQDVGRWWP